MPTAVLVAGSIRTTVPEAPSTQTFPPATARLAGIQAAKRTAHLIPLCHNLGLSHVEVELKNLSAAIEATCTARTIAQTGVEMEALTGVSVALLTIYDMCKAVDKQMRIGDVRLLKKTKHET